MFGIFGEPTYPFYYSGPRRERRAVYTVDPFDLGDAFVFREAPRRRSHHRHGLGFSPEASRYANATGCASAHSCSAHCNTKRADTPTAAPPATPGPHRRRHHHHHHRRHKHTPETEEPEPTRFVTPWGTYVYYVNDDASQSDTDAEQEDVPEETPESKRPESDDADLEVVEIPNSPADHEPSVEIPQSPELGLSASDVSDEEVLEAFRELKARVEAQEAAERAAEEAREKARFAREMARERKEAERRRLEEAAREEAAREEKLREEAIQAELQEEAQEKRRAEEKRARRKARKLEKRRLKEEKEELKSKHAKTEESAEPFEVVEEAADQTDQTAELESTFDKYSTLLDAVEERVNRLSTIDLNGRKKIKSFISLVESYYPKVDKVYLKLDDLRVPKDYRKQKHAITARAVGMADRLDALLAKLKNALETLNETESDSDSSVSSGSHRYTVTLEDVDDSDSS